MRQHILKMLLATTAEAALLFGRGVRAGVDRREQKKVAAGHEAELLRKVRFNVSTPCSAATILFCLSRIDE